MLGADLLILLHANVLVDTRPHYLVIDCGELHLTQ